MYIDINGHTNCRRLNIEPPEKSDYFLPLLADAWDNDIASVAVTGNYGP